MVTDVLFAIGTGCHDSNNYDDVVGTHLSHLLRRRESKSQEVNKIIFVIVMCNIFAVGTELSDYHVTWPTSMVTCLPITPITWT
jgi:hypothetical protein